MITLITIFAKAMSTQMAKKGPRPMVICGPSGSGKSTLLRKLFEDFPDTFGFSISHTTRKPRPGEENGIHYHFVTMDEMQRAIASGEFLETACFSGNLYGTSKAAVRNVQSHGKVCILDIEIQGVEQIRQSDLNPILIFNNPPTIDDLEKRLRKRNTETDDSLKKRLEAAQREIEYGTKPGNFDIVILNEHIDIAYAELKAFVISELQKQQREGINVSLREANDD